MEARKAIIIGAGLAGLSAGCYTQMNGYETHIFEHHSKPGGLVTAWKRGDYLIDGCIHYLWGHKPGHSVYDAYREIGAAQAYRTIDVERFRYVNEADGRIFDVTRDLDKFAADAKAISPADAKAIDELVAGAKAMSDPSVIEMGFGNPPELSGRFDTARQMWSMRRILRYFGGPFGRSIAEYVRDFKDPWLRNILEYIFLPECPVWFIQMLLGVLASGQLGIPEEGSLAFSRSIEKRFTGLGGRVTYRADVEKILVENDTAVGVRLADGSEHRADVVVSAADGHSTIFGMLDGRYIDDQIARYYQEWKIFHPMIIVSFGVTREFADEPYLSYIWLKDPFEIGGKEVSGIAFRIFNYSPAFAPSGKTVIQAELDGDWDFWSTLRENDLDAYGVEKERVAGEILRRLEPRYPGISAHVEMTDVATPYSTWRYTFNHRGSMEGWLPTPQAMTTRMKRTLPGLKNLYLAGQWVMPGGGVPAVVISGRQAAQLICAKDNKYFQTSIP